MWESRVLGEISKALWKPFWGFQRDVMSTVVFAHDVIHVDLQGMLYPSQLADRRS